MPLCYQTWRSLTAGPALSGRGRSMTCRWVNIFNIGVDLHKPRSHPDCEARLQNPAAVTVNACFWPPVTAGPEWHVPLQVHRYLVVLDGAWNAGFDVTAACRGPVPRPEPSIRALPQTGRKGKRHQQSKQFLLFSTPRSLADAPRSPSRSQCPPPPSSSPISFLFASPPLPLFPHAPQLQSDPSTTGAGRRSAACC